MARADLYQSGYQETLQQVADVGGADLVFTSPPYCDARTYGEDISWGFEDYQELGDCIFQALKPGGHCLFNVDAPVRAWRPGMGTERGLMPWRILLDWADRVGFRVVDRLAFSRMGLPGAYAGRFRNDWEPLFWFQRPGAKGYFDKRVLAERASSGNPGMASSRRSDGTLSPRKATGWAVKEGKKHRGALWDYGAVGKGHSGGTDIEGLNHPARFPLRLAMDVVGCFSAPGSLVCDPFLGGGTTMVAALFQERSFMGGDMFGNDGGKLWVECAAEIAVDRFGSKDLALFGLEDSHSLRVVYQDREVWYMGNTDDG